MDLLVASSSLGAIEKACRVLKAMSDRRNTRLTDIAAHCGLDKSTTMRVLESLASEGLVTRDPETKRYAIGPEVARIARGVGDTIDWYSLAHPSLVRLAGAFEDTAIVSALSGLEMVCVDVQAGTYPIRAQYQDVGSRRTLGVGSSGMAVLAALPEIERAAMLPQLTPRLSRYPMLTRTLIDRTIARTCETGYAVLIDAVVPRMGGIAAVICGPGSEPVGALSIAALSDRILDREAELGAALTREARRITDELAGTAGARDVTRTVA
jgi:DNA-binding IclR family transcriptional regulator